MFAFCVLQPFFAPNILNFTELFVLLFITAHLAYAQEDVASSWCDILYLSSNGLQSDLTGIYEYNKIINGRPSYEHQTCPYFLYHIVDESLQYWIVGPVNNGRKGYLIQFSSSLNPHLGNETWVSYDDVNQKWVNDSLVVAVCVSYVNTSFVTMSTDSTTRMLPVDSTSSQTLQNEQPVTAINENSTPIETTTIVTSNVPIPHPVAYWTLQNPHNGTDLGSNQFNLTSALGNYPRFSSGPGLKFTGKQNDFFFILMLTGRSLSFLNLNMTLTFWFYPEGTGGVLQYTGLPGTQFTTVGLTIVYRNRSIAITTSNIFLSHQTPYQIKDVINEDSWNHVAFTFYDEIDIVQMYVNGTLVWSESIPDWNRATVYPLFFIGVWTLNIASKISESFQGNLTCVGMYDKYFDERQVIAEMTSCESVIDHMEAGSRGNVDGCENKCESSPCLNGAICEESCHNYKCLCKNGFVGDRCESPSSFIYDNNTKTSIFVVATALDFSDGYYICGLMDSHSHLAVINNAEQNTFILSEIAKQSVTSCPNGYWTSGMIVNEVYTWKATNSPINYYPNSLKSLNFKFLSPLSECVCIKPNGQWSVSNCRQGKCAICMIFPDTKFNRK